VAEPRWQIAHTGACDLDCDHVSCQAFERAQGICLLCTNPLEDAVFAYRSNGTGASHPACRMDKLGHAPTLPPLVSEEGEFQIGIPRSDDEADGLRRFADAARRFLTAAEGVLRVYDGVDVVALREGGS
jgi:hypothetical protein